MRESKGEREREREREIKKIRDGGNTCIRGTEKERMQRLT